MASFESNVMRSSIGAAAPSVIGARVEPASPPVGGDGSTRADAPRVRPTVDVVNLRDLPMSGTAGPPKGLRALGWLAMAAIVGTTLVADPQPHEEPFVALGLALFVAGLALSLPRRDAAARPAVRRARLIGASSCVLAALQPDGAGFAGIYFVMVIGGMRLERDAAIVVCGGSLAALVAGARRRGQPGDDRRACCSRSSRGF